MAITLPASDAKPAEPADGEQMLAALERELLVQRLRRRPVNAKALLLLRWASVLLLLGLLAAGLGAMWYLQTVAAQHEPAGLHSGSR